MRIAIDLHGNRGQTLRSKDPVFVKQRQNGNKNAPQFWQNHGAAMVTHHSLGNKKPQRKKSA
jgi:hypothetical protein